MYVLTVRNPQQALPELMYLMKEIGVRRESRNGPVLRIPGPCCIKYTHPLERVVFWPERDANPFFHLLEAMWMLAGREDVAYPASLVNRMKDYSDDGIIFHGAYGYRWRKHFEMDQPLVIADALKRNPNDRRQVLTMWDPESDLGVATLDAPCNTHAYFSRDEKGRLDMTVCNRSNDSVWGALGSNAVHFSILQEIMAGLIGCEVGMYWQFSNNMHLYLDQHEGLMQVMANKAFPSTQFAAGDPYLQGDIDPTSLVPNGDVPKFLADVTMYLDCGPSLGCTSSFIRQVVHPMTMALKTYRGNKSPSRFEIALDALKCMPERSDWRLAAEEWIERRRKAFEERHSG
jgi:hypothetical protein